MTMRDLNLAKAELTPDEQTYVDARSWLRRAREEYFAQGGEPTEDTETEVSVREWVKDASKDDIKGELDERGIEYDARASKQTLSKLLVEAVESDEEDEDEDPPLEAAEVSEDEPKS